MAPSCALSALSTDSPALRCLSQGRASTRSHWLCLSCALYSTLSPLKLNSNGRPLNRAPANTPPGQTLQSCDHPIIMLLSQILESN